MQELGSGSTEFVVIRGCWGFAWSTSSVRHMPAMRNNVKTITCTCSNCSFCVDPKPWTRRLLLRSMGFAKLVVCVNQKFVDQQWKHNCATSLVSTAPLLPHVHPPSSESEGSRDAFCDTFF
jgi:hypothetical protein